MMTGDGVANGVYYPMYYKCYFVKKRLEGTDFLGSLHSRGTLAARLGSSQVGVYFS